MAWSEDDDERLTTLWDEGVPSEQIGQAMGRSKSAVLGRARRLNVTPRPNPSVAVADVERTPKQVPHVVVQPEPLPAPRLAGRPQQPWRLNLVPTGPVKVCQWPEGPRRAVTFCDAPAVSGRPYCTLHCRIAFVGFGHRTGASYTFGGMS
jgi:GcrA cell cycle regulator